MKDYLSLVLVTFLFLLNIALLIAPIIMVAVLGLNPLWLLIILVLCITTPLLAMYVNRWL